MLNNKASVSWTVFNVNAGVIVLLGMFLIIGIAVIVGVNGSDVHGKTGLSNEFGSTVQEMIIGSGNTVFFHFGEFDYPLDISQENIVVGDEESKKEYLFFDDGTHKIAPVIIDAGDRVGFFKEGDTITVTDDLPYRFNKFLMTCPSVLHSPLSSVTIDPGHGGSDSGFLSGTIRESVLTRQVLSRLLSDSDIFLTSIPKSTDDTILLLENRVFDGDAAVSIHFGEASAVKNELLFFVNAKNEYFSESKLLACYMLNHLSTLLLKDDIFITGAAIIPVNPTTLDSDDPLNVLNKNTVGVFVDAGSMSETGDKTGIIAVAIRDGVRDYGVQTTT
jgi:hypothetical protein